MFVNFQSLAMNARGGAVWLCVFLMQGAHGTECNGRVADLGLNPDGAIFLSMKSDAGSELFSHAILCSTRAPSNAIEPAACRAIYATLLAAKLSDRRVSLWIDGRASNSSDCTPTRVKPYVVLPNSPTDWYFGPVIRD